MYVVLQSLVHQPTLAFYVIPNVCIGFVSQLAFGQAPTKCAFQSARCPRELIKARFTTWQQGNLHTNYFQYVQNELFCGIVAQNLFVCPSHHQ